MVWSPQGLSVQILDSLEALEVIQPEWRAVWERDPAAAPFQSPDWLLPWTRHLWGGGQLRVLAVRSGRDAVAFAPFFLWGFGSRPEIIRLSWLGSGISDHLDMIAVPGFAIEAARRILGHLAATRGEWHICDLQELPSGSPLLRVEMPAGLSARSAPCGICPVLRLPASMDQFLAGVDPVIRHHLRIAHNRLRRAGGGEFVRAQASDCEALMRDLFRLHTARWSGRGEAGVLSASRLRSFHLEVASRLAAAGALQLHALRLDGRAIAVLYNFRRLPRFYFYLSGFDPAYARFSPGVVLLAEAIGQAISESAAEIDLLRRQEDFKYQWGAREVVSRRLRIYRSAASAELVA